MELQNLARMALPIKTSWGIDKIMQKTEKPFRFFAEKEAEILQQIKPKDIQQNGRVMFESAELRKQYDAAHKELDEIDEDIHVNAVQISLDADIRISREGLRLLSDLGFIEIIGEEEEDEGDERDADTE